MENKRSYLRNTSDKGKGDGHALGRLSRPALLLAAFLLLAGQPQLWALTAQLQLVPTLLTPFAGNGAANCNDTGYGGPATSGSLGTVTAAAADSLGNVYIVDQACNAVRKVDSAGNITNFAGIPSFGGGFSGDTGPATGAQLNSPLDVAVDSSNNVYIADFSNHRIRVVNALTGIITTFAGSGNGFFNAGFRTTTPISGPTGLTFDPAGNLYFSTAFQQVVGKIDILGNVTALAGQQIVGGPSSGQGIAGYTGNGGLAVNATLSDPMGLASDTLGNIYIADVNNYVIRKVDTAGNISTVAGTNVQGNTGDNGPALSAEINVLGVATDLAGDLYITGGSAGGNLVRKVDTAGNITTYAGGGAGGTGGAATSALLADPYYARVDLNGDLVIPVNNAVVTTGPRGILAFGNQNVNTTSSALTLTLVNTGDLALNLGLTAGANFEQNGSTGAGIITGDFAVAPGGTCTFTTLAPGATCTVNVTFTATTATALTGTITMDTSAPDSPNIVQLTGTGVASSVTASGSIAFGNQAENTTSTAQVATLTNSGAMPINITSVSITGANPSDFAETTTCGATLAAAASCTASVTFTPTATGSLNAVLNFNDSDPGSPQTVALNGTGTAPAVSLSTPNLAFGNQPMNTTSAAMMETVTNSGSAILTISTVAIGGANSGDFAKSADACTGANLNPTPAANSTCTVGVTFTPTGPGARSGTLIFTDNAPDSPESAALTGFGNPPMAGLSSSSLMYSGQAVGTTSAMQSIILTNSGTAALTITSIAIGPNFAQTNNCGGVVAAETTCTINVTFTPTTAGSLNGTLTITDNNNGVAGSTQTVMLNGTGTAPAANLSGASLTFANQLVTTTSAAMIEMVTNTGTANLSIATALLGGANAADFAKSADTCTGAVLAPAPAANSTCTVSVTFTPPVTGALAATLTFTDNTNEVAGSTQSVTLAGTGIAPSISFPSATLNFGSQTLNTTSTALTETITNNGQASLSIATVTLGGANPGDFAITADTCAEIMLAPNSTCLVSATFTPLVTGALGATLTFTDNNNGVAGSTQTLSLTGTGGGPVASLSAASITFANQPISTTSAAMMVIVTNTGPLSLTITTAALGGANAADFAKSADNCTGATVAPNATCTVSMTFTPAATGAFSGTLTFTDNNTGGAGPTQAVTLSGEGVDFSVASPTAAQTVAQGGSAQYTVNVLPVVGSDTAAVTMSCSNLPVQATCTFSPNPVTPGASGTTTQLTITTAAPVFALTLPPSSVQPPPGPPLRGLPMLLLAMTLPLLVGWWRVRRKSRRWAAASGLLFGALLATAFMAGCGGGGGNGYPLPKVGGTATGTYTVTVTGTSGATQHTTTVTLNVNAS